jgi:ATP-binding cassette, subfamily B, bacterial
VRRAGRESKGTHNDRATLIRVARELRGEWGSVGLYGLLQLLATPLALLGPVPVALAVDSAVGGEPLPGWLDAVMPQGFSSAQSVLLLACVLQVVIVLLAQAQSVLSTWVYTSFTERATQAVRIRLLRHAQTLSFRFHDQRGTTDTIYRVQYDAGAIPGVATSSLIPFVSAIFTLVAMIVVVARLDSQIAVVALAISPILLVLTRVFRLRLKARYREVKLLESGALKVIQEVLTAFRVVKAFGREREEEDRYREEARAAADARIGVSLEEHFFSLLIAVVMAGGTATVLYLGVNSVLADEMTVGALLLILSYLSQLYSPLQTISRQTTKVQSQLASAERVIELLDEEPEVKDDPDALPVDRASGAFVFENVSFHYEEGNEVLVDVSFVVPAGATLGIVGRTGAGKSTLMSLLIRFYDPTGGRILLDRIDLRSYRLRDLRNQFSMVLQDPFLFSSSIIDNIRYARPEASNMDVIAAAEAAGIHDFIAGLEDGYDTLVGERGMRLSGGERQRISLARAFLKDAPILLLDEPTSSVDIETEASIMEAMGRLMHGRTTFMIAHRLSTLEGCDLVLRVKDGAVTPVDEGLVAPTDLDSSEREVHKLETVQESVNTTVLHAHEDEFEAEATRAAEFLVPGFRAGEVQPYSAERQHSSAYRVFERDTGRSLALKLVAEEVGDLESAVYTQLLPAANLSMIRGHGTVESDLRPGACWLAVDHVSGRDFEPSRIDDTTALSRWVGALHVRGQRLDAARKLPLHDASHWRSTIEEARDVLRACFGNSAITKREDANIWELAFRFDEVLHRWQGMEELQALLPSTVTHGDLMKQNVRMVGDGSALVPAVLDWETVGFGPPILDLALLDLDVYRAAVFQAWPEITTAHLCRLRALGAVVWTAYVVSPESASLTSAWPHRAAGKIPAYLERLDHLGYRLLLESPSDRTDEHRSRWA